MRGRVGCAAIIGIFLSSTALAVGTVSFSLTSPVAGTQVQPGTTVDWTLRLSVSTGDNLGLALFVCDLVQDAANPEKFNIPPGNPATIPAAMAGFDRPGGITNPGEGGASSGYIGVQRGTDGQKNLIQIGGAQNTFGQAGTGFATDPFVDQGIGQPGPQLVLSGSFPAPATPGLYTFRIVNAEANVLTNVQSPPNHSTVDTATTDVSNASFSFTVAAGPEPCPGDMNCDGQINFDDIDPFVTALVSQTCCDGTGANCDVNGDGNINFSDIDPFVVLLASGAQCP